MDAGNVLRALFGVFSDRPRRWLDRALDAAVALRDAMRELSHKQNIHIFVRAALASGAVHLEPGALADAETAVRRSPIDVATRIARNAPAGEILLNAACWRHVGSGFSGQACDTIRSRGAQHPELVYRAGSRTVAAPRRGGRDGGRLAAIQNTLASATGRREERRRQLPPPLPPAAFTD